MIFTLGKQTFVMDRELTHPATRPATGETGMSVFHPLRSQITPFLPGCAAIKFHPSISGGTSKPNLSHQGAA